MIDDDMWNALSAARTVADRNTFTAFLKPIGRDDAGDADNAPAQPDAAAANVAPVIDLNGVATGKTTTLSYLNYGAATAAFTLVDGGGMTSGGADTGISMPTINLAASNTAPVFTAPTFSDTRVSTNSAGAQVNSASSTNIFGSPVFSPDNSKIVFFSGASDLVSGDTNSVDDVFLKDLTSGAVTRLSITDAGVQANGPSLSPTFSPDGTIVVFTSAATNLVAGDDNASIDIFAKNLATGVITRVNTLTGGTQMTGGSAYNPIFSPDGTKVLFQSAATNFAGDTNGGSDLFVKDLTTGTLTRVSTDATGTQANGESYSAVFSPDGTKVAFYSSASNLVAGDTNFTYDIFVKDLTTGNVTIASSILAGVIGNNASYNPVFSPDGTMVAFESVASNLVLGDTNGTSDIFVKNLVTGTIQRVSTDASGAQTNGISQVPIFSPDGTKIAFTSSSSNLVAGDTNGAYDVFVKDLISGEIIRVSTTTNGTQATSGASQGAAWSRDGSQLIFMSAATNLVAGDTNGATDIFLASLGSFTPTFVEHGAAVQIAPRVTVSDDGATFADGSLTVAITAGGAAGDTLSLSGGGITIAGTVVSYNGTPIGTQTTGVASLSVALNADATIAAVSALTQAVRYASTANIDSVSTRTIGFTLVDGGGTAGGGSDTASFTRTVNVYAVNEAPVLATTAANPTYVEHTGSQQTDPVALFAGTTINTVEPGQTITQLKLTIAGLVDGANDQLLVDGLRLALGGFSSQSGTTLSGYAFLIQISGTTATITLTRSAGMTVAAAQALVDGIGYTNTNIDNPTAGDRVFTLTSITDNGGVSAGGADTTALSIASTVHVVPTNDAPTFALTPLMLASSDTNATVANASSLFNSTTQVFSGDGKYVVFSSSATNLVAGDANAQQDVFLKNLDSGEVTLVSRTAAVQGDGASQSASISADGTKVAFISAATNLVSGDTNATTDLFVKNLSTGDITRASVSSAGIQGNSSVVAALISADGTKVAFTSAATTLVSGDTNGLVDIFVKDLATGAIIRANTNASGTQSAAAAVLGGMSADGTKLVFVSGGTDLVAGDTNSSADVFVKNLVTGAITRVSTNSSNAQVSSAILATAIAAISADGTKVAFASASAGYFSGDTNGVNDIYVKDLTTGAITLVSVKADGTLANSASSAPVFSPDGTKIAFISAASNLVAGDTNGSADVFVKDLLTGALMRYPFNASGVQASGASSTPTFSPDGTKIGFVSGATNLTTDNSVQQVYFVPLSSPTASYVEQGVAVQVAPSIAVNDIDSTNFAGGSFAATIAASVAGDALSLSGFGITVAGTTVSYNGTAIGTLTQSATALSVALNASATPAGTSALVQAVRFASTSDDPGTSRTVTFGLNDGAGGSTSYDRTVNITAINDAPTTANIAGDIALHAVNTSGYTVVDVGGNATITDIDSADFAGGTLHVALTTGAIVGEDQLLALSNDTIVFTGDTDLVIVNGVTIGSFSHGVNFQSLDFTFNANATPARVQEIIRALNYYGSGATVGDRTVAYTLVDGDGGSDTVMFSSTVRVDAVPNQAPVLDLDSTAPGTGVTLTTLEGDFPTVAPHATLTDSDSPVFGGGSLTVSYGAGVTSTDAIGVQDQGGQFAGGGRIGVNLNTIYYNTVPIGSVTSSGLGQPLIVTFNANATPVAVQALLYVIGTINISDAPPTGSRPLTFTVTDGDGGSSSAIADITVTPVNDAPVIDLNTTTAGINDTSIFNEGSFSAAIGSAINVSDPDGDTIKGAVVTITDAVAGDSIVYNLPLLGGITIDPSSTVSHVVLTGTATAAQYAQALGQFSYTNSSDDPTIGGTDTSRTITVTVNDGTVDSAVATSTITVFGVNDAPVLGAGGNTIGYTEQAGATVVNAALTVVDPDSATLTGATVTIGGRVAGDVLTFVNQNGITGSFDASTGILTLSGSASLASYQATLRTIAFSSTSDNPTAYGASPTRTINLVVDDGQAANHASAATTTTINVIAVNDAPISTGFDNVTFTEGMNYAQLDTGFNQVLTDPDSANFDGGSLTVRISGNHAPAEDALALLTGGGSFLAIAGHSVTYQGVAFATFQDASDGDPGEEFIFTFNANATVEAVQTLMRNQAYVDINQANPSTAQRTIDYVLTDGDGGTQTLHSTVDVVAVNDAPTGADATIVVGQGMLRALHTTDFGYADVEGDAFVSVTISSAATAGRLLYLAPGATNYANVTAGQVISVADLDAGRLVYKMPPGSNATSGSFTFQVHDNGGTANGGVDIDPTPNTVTFNVQPNIAPEGHDVTVAIVRGQVYAVNAADFGFSDPDGYGFAGVTVTTAATAGRLLYLAPGASGYAPVTAGQFISAADIAAGRLTFKLPDAATVNTASITFQVQDDGGTGLGGIDKDQSPNTLTFNTNPPQLAATAGRPAADQAVVGATIGHDVHDALDLTGVGIGVGTLHDATVVLHDVGMSHDLGTAVDAILAAGNPATGWFDHGAAHGIVDGLLDDRLGGHDWQLSLKLPGVEGF